MSNVKSIGTNREKDIKPSIHQKSKNPSNYLRFFVGGEGFESTCRQTGPRPSRPVSRDALGQRQASGFVPCFSIPSLPAPLNKQIVWLEIFRSKPISNHEISR